MSTPPSRRADTASETISPSATPTSSPDRSPVGRQPVSPPDDFQCPSDDEEETRRHQRHLSPRRSGRGRLPSGRRQGCTPDALAARPPAADNPDRALRARSGTEHLARLADVVKRPCLFSATPDRRRHICRLRFPAESKEPGAARADPESVTTRNLHRRSLWATHTNAPGCADDTRRDAAADPARCGICKRRWG